MATSSQCEIRGLSEIFFDSIIETDDKRLNMEDYNLIRADQPGNKKGERYVCINYKKR